MRALILAAALAAAQPAIADGPWVFEFEFGVPLEYSTSRLLLSDCTKVVPVELVEWYVEDPRAGWEISCGNDRPIYNHFLGRRIGRPLPNLDIELGWRHLSSPGDHHGIEYDAIAVRGRFRWGKQ